MEYYYIKRNKHHKFFEGFESTVLSYEMDYLDDILYINIVSTK